MLHIVQDVPIGRHPLGPHHQGKNYNQEQDDDRAFHRSQLEMLVQTAKQSIRDATTPPPTMRDFGTQTDSLPPSPSLSTSSPVSAGTTTTDSRKIESEENQGGCSQIQRWDDAPDDCARLLYRLVFEDLRQSDADSTALQKMSTADMALTLGELSQRHAVDRMLLEYSYLEPHQIQESEDGGESDDVSSDEDIVTCLCAFSKDTDYRHLSGCTSFNAYWGNKRYAAGSSTTEGSNSGWAQLVRLMSRTHVYPRNVATEHSTHFSNDSIDPSDSRSLNYDSESDSERKRSISQRTEEPAVPLETHGREADRASEFEHQKRTFN